MMNEKKTQVFKLDCQNWRHSYN